jgi:23S rRNA pseudouridine1911/1915/1917 synthase
VRWIVRAGDGPTVADVLSRAGADPDAVRDGRVFVQRERVRRGDHRVRAGDEVRVAPPQGDPPEPACILLRAGDVVAADKPAGVPTIADHAGTTHTLVAMVAHALSMDPSRLHPTSRLDRDVSGVVVFTLSSRASELLRLARAEGRYERRYVAIASRAPEPDRGTWDAPIGRAANPRLRKVGGRDAVAASTRYAVTGAATSGATLLAVAPVTGRTHQIRVHAAHGGAPLLGDRAYGGPTRVTLPSGRVLEPGRIALHAARVVVPDEAGEPLAITSPIPAELRSLWSALGGDAAAWEVLASGTPDPGATA